MSELTEQALHDPPHAPVPADDRHRARLVVQRDLGAQRRLLIATRAQQQAEDRLDLPRRQTERLGVVCAVVEHLALASHVANLQPVRALVRRHLGHK